MEPRIVCAAVRTEEGVIICSVRHFDHIGVKIAELIPSLDPNHGCHQGFVTNKGEFVDRNTAWKIAKKAGQILRRCGGDTTAGGTLYSENLY